MLFKRRNAKKDTEFRKILDMYAQQIETLINKRNYWSEMLCNFDISGDLRNEARLNIIEITMNITELENAREKFLEESF